MSSMRWMLTVVVGCFCVSGTLWSAEKPTAEWVAEIREFAPSEAPVKPKAKRKVLLFSLMTGFQHSVTPYTSEVVKLLGDKSGAYEVVASDDVEMFTPEKIKGFDVIVLNNTCSKRDNRNMFLDVTGDKEKAAELEKSLIAHVADGHGLVLLHGGIVMQNNSMAFSEMCGGSFDFHPKQQKVTCTPLDPKHPLVLPFEGKPFTHVDEPYLFNKAYVKLNFRPLLEMDAEKLDAGKRTEKVRSIKRYVAWIKKHGEGRVFYCSPSHNPESYKIPGLLEFILRGFQYAAGDLECEDSPIEAASDQ